MAKKTIQSQRLRLTSESLNCYGTWLVTAGGNIEQYQRNPVLLYMHRRGEVIGHLEDIRIEPDNTITAEPVFDDVTETSRQVHQQYDKGSLRMASVGLDVIELSEDPKMLKEGQTSPTITKWKLREVSIVDIGANDDALRLYRDGVEMTLSDNGSNPLPKLKIQKESIMELTKLALSLGLAATATEAEVAAKIAQLMADSQELTTLRAEKEQLTLAAITAAVDGAIGENRLSSENRDKFISLGKKVGLDDLKTTLAAMSPAVKLSTVINPSSASSGSPTEYKKLSEVPCDKLADMRANDKETYRKLYKAEYGFECEI